MKLFIFLALFLTTANCLKWPNIPFLDADIFRDVPGMIKARGFQEETHPVTTRDGYILDVHRMQHPKKTGGYPIMLVPGILGSSALWFINSPDGNADEPLDKFGDNIGCELAKRGYDVWMMNTRGNTYAKKHVNMTTKDDKFWDFRIDEIVDYDIPDVLDYIANLTGHKKVGALSVSQGAQMIYGTMASHKKYNDMIAPFISMCGFATVGHGGHINITDLYNFRVTWKRLFVFLRHYPAAMYQNNLKQLGQMRDTGRFQRFDFGNETNLVKYGSRSPPIYDLGKITNPDIANFWSKDDGFNSLEDREILIQTLGSKFKTDYVIPEDNWSHIDFLVGNGVGEIVFKHVLSTLKDYH